MILCISVLSVVISPFRFLILLIWFFSLCFLMCLANGLSVLFILSKSQLLALLIFAMVSFVSFAFIYALIFLNNFFNWRLIKIFSFYYPWGSSFLPFLVALGIELSYLFDFFLVSWGMPVLLWTFPLALFDSVPQVLACVFSFSFVSMHILISSVICWLFSSVLFSLHMFELLIVFLL